MKTVARFREGYEAHIAKGLLELHGIPATVIDEHIVAMNWLYSLAVGGVKLQVEDEHADKAREILEKDYSADLEQVHESEFSPTPKDTCQKCHSDSVSPNRYSLWWLFPSLAFTMPIFFRRKNYRCNACGHRW